MEKKRLSVHIVVFCRANRCRNWGSLLSKVGFRVSKNLENVQLVLGILDFSHALQLTITDMTRPTSPVVVLM